MGMNTKVGLNMTGDCLPMGDHSRPTHLPGVYVAQLPDGAAQLPEVDPKDVKIQNELVSLANFLKEKIYTSQYVGQSRLMKEACSKLNERGTQAQSVHVGEGMFALRRGMVAYQYTCTSVNMPFRESAQCYEDILVIVTETVFIVPVTLILKKKSLEIPCLGNFPVLVQ